MVGSDGLDSLPPVLIDLPRRPGQIAGPQQMHRIAQVCSPLGPPRLGHADLCGAQGQTFSQQALGDVSLRHHKMQVAERRARQKRHIFKGFAPGRGDPRRHPR